MPGAVGDPRPSGRRGRQEFTPGDFEWAAKRTADGLPTLLVPISPGVGIVQADVDLVADWAKGQVTS
jgi:hypothetical protein